MQRVLKGGVVLALLAAIVFEVVQLAAVMLNAPSVDTLPPESTAAAGATCLDLTSADGLSGVAAKLVPYQQTYQTKSTSEIAAYIEEANLTEETRLARAREKAAARQAFFERQEELARQAEQLIKEKQEAQQAAGMPSISDQANSNFYQQPGIYGVGQGSSLNDPSSVTSIGSTVTGLGGNGSVVGGDVGNVGAAGDLDTGSHYVPSYDGASLNDINRPGENNLGTAPTEPNLPVASDSPDNYCGEFVMQLVCTCSNCFNPDLWPQSRLSDSFILADPSFLAPGIQVQLTSSEFGTYTVHDADGVVTGRNIILFHGSHGLGPESDRLYVKVYNVSK